MRDLPAKTGAVLPDDGFAMAWQLLPTSWPRLKGIEDALLDSRQRGTAIGKGVTGVAPTHLVLATDPDREGEAISWHVAQELEVGLRREFTVVFALGTILQMRTVI